MRLNGYDKTYGFNITLEFRTYEENRLIRLHMFISEGYIKLLMENSRIKVSSNDVHAEKQEKNKASLNVDIKVSFQNRKLKSSFIRFSFSQVADVDY